MIAADLAYALDPVLLARRSGLEPDPWQTNFLRSQARQTIMLCSRQCGKSTVASRKAIHRALYEPGAPILCLSPSKRQSGELFKKISAGLRRLGPRAVRLVEENKQELSLANESRIICLPGNEMT
ncbi:MAG TPA: hypothetical protein VGP44_08340, partial [Gemmatimonadales bacterium]|nr:hypothetical protein [Gemmatimonadales bacterium]